MKKSLLLIVLSILFSCEPQELQQGKETKSFELRFKKECTEGNQDSWYFNVTEEFFNSFIRNNQIENCGNWYSVGDIEGNIQEGYFIGTRKTGSD